MGIGVVKEYKWKDMRDFYCNKGGEMLSSRFIDMFVQGFC